MNRMCVSMVMAAVVTVTSASRADAQTASYFGYLTGQIGTTTGGDVPDSTLTPAVSVSVLEGSGWGAELDAGFANGDPSPGHELDLATYMVNAIWLARTGIVRPYVVGGAGVIQVRGCFSVCAQIDTVSDLGVNFGGGAFYPYNDIVGIRGDVRYFWAPGDKTGNTRPGNYGFWRVSVGVTFMWSITP